MKALFRIGTGSSLDVFRAEQALLVAKNSQSNAVEQFQNALDNFVHLIWESPSTATLS